MLSKFLLDYECPRYSDLNEQEFSCGARVKNFLFLCVLKWSKKDSSYSNSPTQSEDHHLPSPHTYPCTQVERVERKTAYFHLALTDWMPSVCRCCPDSEKMLTYRRYSCCLSGVESKLIYIVSVRRFLSEITNPSSLTILLCTQGISIMSGMLNTFISII